MKNEQPSIDRQVLAREVIVSASNILRAAGFGPDEIGEFFRQAADHLEVGMSRPDALPAQDHATQPDALADIREKFLESPAVRELQQLGLGAKASQPPDERISELKERFDTAMRMIPLIAEAQNALRLLARDAALPLYANRGEWMRSVERSNLPASAPIICLEDFELPYRGTFDFIAALLDILLDRGDSEAFAFVLGHLAENGVVISGALQTSVERGAEKLERM